MHNPLVFHSLSCCSIHQPLWKLYQRHKCSLGCFGCKNKVKLAHKTKSNCFNKCLKLGNAARLRSAATIQEPIEYSQKMIQVDPWWVCSSGFTSMGWWCKGQTPAHPPCCAAPSGMLLQPLSGLLSTTYLMGSVDACTMLDVSFYAFFSCL